MSSASRVVVSCAVLWTSACLGGPAVHPRMECTVVSHTLVSEVDDPLGFRTHGPRALELEGCSYLVPEPQYHDEGESDCAHPGVVLQFWGKNSIHAIDGDALQPIAVNLLMGDVNDDGTPFGGEPRGHTGCPKSGDLFLDDSAYGYTGTVGVDAKAWPMLKDAGDSKQVTLSLVLDSKDDGNDTQRISGDLVVSLAATGEDAPVCPEGAQSRSNRHFCLGRGEACSGKTLPCCTTECEDHAGRKHDGSELTCDGTCSGGGGGGTDGGPGGDGDPCGLQGWAEWAAEGFWFSAVSTNRITCSGSTNNVFVGFLIPTRDGTYHSMTWHDGSGGSGNGACPSGPSSACHEYSLDADSCLFEFHGECDRSWEIDVKRRSCPSTIHEACESASSACLSKPTMPPGCTVHAGTGG